MKRANRHPWILLSVLIFSCGPGSVVTVSSGAGGGVGGTTDANTSSASTVSGASSSSAGGEGGSGGSACTYLENCKTGCASAVPQPFPPNAACSPEELQSACISKCCESTSKLNPLCAACVAQTISASVSDDSCDATAGIFLDCAVGACDTVYPCSEAACNNQSHCIRPCPPPMGINWGVCSFENSGTCLCGAAQQDNCAAGTTCLCPVCGEGEGVCVNPAQKASVCFDYIVSPLAEATAHFLCP